MKIEILFFEGCPHSESAIKLVADTVIELGIDASIDTIKVVDNDDAIAKNFLGSPSVRINGKDIEYEENELTEYSMRCRVYRDGDRQSGVPFKNLIIQKLKEASI